MVRVKVSASRLCKAAKDTIWNLLEDLEDWPRWADPQSKTHILSHKVLQREGNTALVDEEGIAGGYRIRHTDKYTFYPKHKLTEDVVKGPMSGSWTLTLQDTEDGTTINWSFDVKPETRMFWLLSLFRGRKILQGVCNEYCRQLSEYAEVVERTRR